jgi:hypothetical protein
MSQSRFFTIVQGSTFVPGCIPVQPELDKVITDVDNKWARTRLGKPLLLSWQGQMEILRLRGSGDIVPLGFLYQEELDLTYF